MLGQAVRAAQRNPCTQANVESEAKRNIVSTLVTGIAAMSDPSGAAAANNASISNLDNNSLVLGPVTPPDTTYTVFLLALVVTPIAGRLSKSRPQYEMLAGTVALGIFGPLLTLWSLLWMIVLGLALGSAGVFLAQASANALITARAGR